MFAWFCAILQLRLIPLMAGFSWTLSTNTNTMRRNHHRDLRQTRINDACLCGFFPEKNSFALRIALDL